MFCSRYSVLGVWIYTVIFYTDFVPIKEYCPLLAKDNMATIYMRMLKFWSACPYKIRIENRWRMYNMVFFLWNESKTYEVAESKLEINWEIIPDLIIVLKNFNRTLRIYGEMRTSILEYRDDNKRRELSKYIEKYIKNGAFLREKERIEKNSWEKIMMLRKIENITG